MFWTYRIRGQNPNLGSLVKINISLCHKSILKTFLWSCSMIVAHVRTVFRSYRISTKNGWKSFYWETSSISTQAGCNWSDWCQGTWCNIGLKDCLISWIHPCQVVYLLLLKSSSLACNFYCLSFLFYLSYRTHYISIISLLMPLDTLSSVSSPNRNWAQGLPNNQTTGGHSIHWTMRTHGEQYDLTEFICDRHPTYCSDQHCQWKSSWGDNLWTWINELGLCEFS